MWVVVVGGAVILIAVLVLHANRVERKAVAAAVQVLPNHVREGFSHRFSGQLRGVDLTLVLVQRPGDSNPQAGLWSEVHLPVPEGVELELRPQDPVEAHLVAKGLARDASVGEPTFDAKFVVEMAPAILAPAVFDAELRERLLELHPVRVLRAESGGLRLVRRHWEGERFAALAETAALLATGLRQAGGAEAAQAERWGASHVSARAEERADLEKTRAARTSWTIRNVVLVVVGLLVILVLRALLS